MSNESSHALSKSTPQTHIDNSSKGGFGALETLGQVDPNNATYFVYDSASGEEVSQLIRYPEVRYKTNFILNEDIPGIFHTNFSVENFYFADRIDEYAVIDPGVQALFVDVGLYDFCGVEFLDEALALTGTPWKDTEVFITHLHDDHDGNVRYCLEKGARKVYVGKQQPYGKGATERFLQVAGVNRLCPKDVSFYAKRHLKRANQFEGFEDRVVLVGDGDSIQVGEYRFDVLETPGHTPEHVCLVDREKGVFFAGDHVLDTAPGHMSFLPDMHLLKRFLANISYLKTLDLKYIFMCHHEPLIGTDQINTFLEGILRTYDRPINKMFSMVEVENPLPVYALAEKYYSYLDSFVDQPTILLMRRIAIAFSYLEYLFDMGRIERRVAEDGALEYWKS